MSKMSTDPTRHALHGPTMGTRWTALFHAYPGFDAEPLRTALQAAVDEVDAQMSTWKPDSDLMRLNAAPVGVWQSVPARLLEVLVLARDIGRASGGAFDMGLGDAVAAWGFGADEADPTHIRTAMACHRTDTALEIDVAGALVRKTADIALDLNGIAKGYGVDRLADTLVALGIPAALVGIDGEMRAVGLRPDGAPWTIAVEAPDPERRTPYSVLALQDAAVATSGDYRHWVEVQGRRLSHTMDPSRRAPLLSPPASMTVIAPTCAEADAWATALMVLGVDAGATLAEQRGLDALFLMRDDQNGFHSKAVGRLFSQQP
ncbi:FAD:protein FMN transferase [Marivita sp.]|uniref:FAD:protein FMN transferase n=1 Tax=Marivita sp. TaxID=2003365 RepID=UPI003F6BAA26